MFDNASHIRLEIGIDSSHPAVNGVTTIPINKWTFVAGTYDGSIMKVYVNGVLDNSSSLTGSIDTNNMPLSIGRSGYGANYFKGKTDEVKIWNKALNATEVLNEYGFCSDGTAFGSCNNTNKPKYCSSGTLINNCTYCNCSSGQSCNATTNACYTPVQTMIVGVDYWSGFNNSTFINIDLPLLKDAGIQMIRLGFNNGSLANMRTLVPAVVVNGVNVLGLLTRIDLAPDNVSAWGDWVYSTVSEFKNKVHVWECWNEPNQPEFFPGKDPVKYTAFLKKCYEQAKLADPNCTILGGSVVFTNQTSLNFLTKMYQNGAKNYMDRLSYHPYCYPRAPNDSIGGNPYINLTNVRTIMANYNDARPIWITEMGWDKRNTEQQQADYLVKALQMARDWGWVETFIIYNWQDGGGYTFGLLRADHSSKPSFYAVKNFIKS
jgi:hypothetical protein